MQYAVIRLRLRATAEAILLWFYRQFDMNSYAVISLFESAIMHFMPVLIVFSFQLVI